MNLADAMPTTPVSSSPQSPGVEDASAPVTSASTPNTVAADVYPDTVMRPAAAPQITEADRLSATADLRARRERLAGGGTAAGLSRSADDLRRIGGSHADETLRAIEGE